MENEQVLAQLAACWTLGCITWQDIPKLKRLLTDEEYTRTLSLIPPNKAEVFTPADIAFIDEMHGQYISEDE